MPSLPIKNRFLCLSVDNCEAENSSNFTSDSEKIKTDTHTTSTLPKPRKKKWEQRLPKPYILAATPSSQSFETDVEIQTTDTAQRICTKALVDSGATGLFVDWSFVQRHQINTRTLAEPIPVFNVNGTPNEQGAIRDVIDVVLCVKDHSERAVFAITGLGKQDVILGLTWLKQHNPDIDWNTNEIKMTRCPPQCDTRIRENHITRKIRHLENH